MLNLTETETLAAYMKPPSRYGGAGGAGGLDDSSGGPAKGFVVRDAPWNTSGNKVFFFLSVQPLNQNDSCVKNGFFFNNVAAATWW